ncbi:SDR family oxidoreductase [uncultured Spongiibacter sp.]|uniref:SDR family oxidoreductase n=1 Tax=uncultured Spongiibacter sp. TaxID=870896 RepID=UPI00258D74BD|nr:SDR family oxidoreductase [uncultured Spongiibacter sp.]
MTDLFSVSGKTVFISGGSRGIGAMLAEGFVNAGAKVIISARKAAELHARCAHLQTLGDCTAIEADLSSQQGVEALAAAIKSLTTRLDVLINNAGASWGADIDSFPESGWDKVMNLNVKSAFFLSQQLLPLLRNAAAEDNPARIINIASVYGMVHSTLKTYSYGASKAAVIQLTRQLAADLADANINVNAIAPGYFPSDMTAPLDDQSLLQSIPLQRMGSADDIAGTAIFLASAASNYMTGSTLVLDGGIVASR